MNAATTLQEAGRLTRDTPGRIDDWRYTEAWIAHAVAVMNHLAQCVREIQGRQPLTPEQHQSLYEKLKYEGDDGWEIDPVEFGQAIEEIHGITEENLNAGENAQRENTAAQPHLENRQPLAARIVNALLLRVEHAAAAMRQHLNLEDSTAACSQAPAAPHVHAAGQATNKGLGINVRDPAICIGCGCSDRYGCKGGCHWLAVDRERHRGVCSQCAEHLPEFNALRLKE